MSSEDRPAEIPSKHGDLPQSIDDLSFEEWCEMHRSDPDRFEACRLKLLNDLIDAAPDESKPRLRGLMFRMEGEARRSGSQLGYVLRLSSMMMEMLDEMREQMSTLIGGDAKASERRSARESARVLPFARGEDRSGSE